MFERLPTPIRFLAATIALMSSAGADVRLPKIFSDDMLLQRGLAVPVWGWADAGEHIDVHFAGQELRTRADETGRWSVKLDPLEASSEGRSLQVNGRRVRNGEAVDTNRSDCSDRLGPADLLRCLRCLPRVQPRARRRAMCGACVSCFLFAARCWSPPACRSPGC